MSLDAPSKVLLAESSAIARAIHARALRAAGFAVVEATGAAEGALAALREQPAVVVTDLEAPSAAGLPLLPLLKADPALARIPVVALSRRGEASARFLSRRGGADTWLAIDLPEEELVAAVANLVRRSPRAPLSEAEGESRAVSAAESRAETAVASERTGDRGISWGQASRGREDQRAVVDLLSRVVTQLDTALLEANLVAELLEVGLGAADFHEASAAALSRIAPGIDARALAVALGEPEAAFGHIYLASPLAPEDLELWASQLADSLDLPPQTTVEVVVTGERGGARIDLSQAVWRDLAVGSASGRLGILPNDPPAFAAAGEPLLAGLLGPLGLVLENARLALRLRELSSLDGLTRLFNHRAIYERLGEEVERARRYRQPLAIVLCDLDHFKEINDRYGHPTGDAVLSEAAGTLRRALRATDFLGRYGGEEFLAVLPQVDLESARLAAERLRRDLAQREVRLVGLAPLALTGSFGVAALSELGPGATVERLVAAADRRLYEAKAAGRNRVVP